MFSLRADMHLADQLTGGPRAPIARGELVGAFVLSALFLAPLLILGPWDDEEVALGVFASQVHYRALFTGEWLYWLNNLGFGTPLPIGHRLDFHPVFALASLVSLRAALSAVWVVHVAVMVVYFLRLAASSGIRAPLRLVLLACYLFSVVSVAIFYETDWLTYVIAWTLYPVLVFYLRQAFAGEVAAGWFASARLALLFGFWILNSHPGYLAPLAIMLAVYTAASVPIRRPAFAGVLTAVLLCVPMTAERAHAVVSEMRLFPASIGRNVQAGYEPAAHAAAALAPFTPVTGELRLPFVGLVLGLAALTSVLRLPALRDAHVRACSVSFVAAAAFTLAPDRMLRWTGASAVWQFRDPMLFFGLIAGGVMLQRGLDSPWRPVRALVWLLVSIQIVQQAATVRVGFREYIAHRGTLDFYRHQGHPVDLGRTLVERAARYGPRLYLSLRAQVLARASLTPYGLHAITDLVFLGLNPVNAWFKGVSMDRLYPSPMLMHGTIAGQRDVIENDTLLDVLGINMVLCTELEGPVPAGLLPLERRHVRTFRGEEDVVLLGNPDAWPRAVLMDIAARDVALPLRPGCSHDRALCREYGPLATRRLPDTLSLTSGNGRYTVRVAPSERERLLFLSATYRPEWQATSAAGRLRVDPIAGAFLGITVPAGVVDVDIAYVPRVRVALTWFSGITLLVLLVIGFATAPRRPSAIAEPA